jgi:hypothetical protein
MALLKYYNTSNSAWEYLASAPTGPTGPSGSVGRFTTSDTAPVSPTVGDAWFNSNNGKTYIYYTDVDGSQWVETGAAPIGPTGPTGVTGATGPDILAINAQTGTTYTFALSDIAKWVEFNNASAITVTIPSNASVAFPIGTLLNFIQTGAGQVTVAGAAGVTFNSDSSRTKIKVQWGAASLIKRATDTWVLFGNLTSV